MRHDVVALVDANGEQVEQARYSAYGVPFCLPGADCDSDGDVDAFDFIQLGDWIGASVYDVRGDVNLDGVLNVLDYTALGDRSGNAGGRGKLSIANGAKPTNSRFGYAGYLWHQNVGKCHVRNRVYDPALGRWITRDPIEYNAGLPNLYCFVGAATLVLIDPLGLDGWLLIPDVIEYEWWPDTLEGLDGVRETWRDIATSPDPITTYTDNVTDDAIDTVQDALTKCEWIPGADVVTTPFQAFFDLLQQGPGASCQTMLGCINPFPGNRNIKLPPALRNLLPGPGQGIPLRPSGLPKIHTPKAPTRKRAIDQAIDRSPKGTRPIVHPSPKDGHPPHVHPVDKDGDKKPGAPHIEYPRRQATRPPK